MPDNKTHCVRRALAALTMMATGVVALASAPPAGADASDLPTGFTDVAVAAFSQPTSLTPLADGRVLVTGKSGSVGLIAAGTGNVTQVSAPIDVCTNSERGLLGAAQDPGTPSRVFLYYTADIGTACVNRVERFTLSGNSLTNPEIILDNIPSTNGPHNGGDLQISDGLLFVTVGDSACDPRGDSGCGTQNDAAQDRSLLAGKLLRVDLDGIAPPSQSGPGTASCRLTGATARTNVCREIVGRGLRNPFRMAVNPNPKGPRFFVNDVGEGAWEEINPGVIGANYGWNEREGACPAGVVSNCSPAPSGYTDPVFAYTRAEGCSSITGGAFVPDGAWPGYDGAYIYADFICGKLFTLSSNCTSAASDVWRSSELATGIGTVTEIDFVGKDLWYATFGGGIRKIVPPPAPTPGTAGRLVTIAPTRKLDTRSGIGGPAGVVPANGELVVDLAPDVPAGAVGAVVNVTTTETLAPGFVTAWPANLARPFVSTSNVTRADQTVPNMILTAISPSRQLRLFTLGGGHLIVDVYGYFLPAATSAPGRYEAVTPARLLDTRTGNGAPQARVSGSIDLQVTGRGNVPAGASAVAIVLTGTEPAASSFVTAWAAGGAFPPTSTLNMAGPGDTRANLVVVPVGAGGKVSLYANVSTHLVGDVVGWFTGPSASTSSEGLFVPASPRRLLDTREPGRPIGRLAGQYQECDLDAGWGAPASAGAVVANLTAVQPASPTFVSLFPDPSDWPETSNVNTTAQTTIAAAHTIVGFGPGSGLPFDDAITMLSNVATDVVLDVTGWFTG